MNNSGTVTMQLMKAEESTVTLTCLCKDLDVEEVDGIDRCSE